MSIERLIFICNICILILLVPITGFPSEESIRLGLLRSDGVLVPFANFKNGTWDNKWPEPDEYDLDKIDSMKDIPRKWLGINANMASRWFLHDNDGKRKTIEIVKPVLYDTHCETNWGLLTDHDGKKSKYAHIEKTGIVTDLEVVFFKAVDESDNTTIKESLLKAINGNFNDLEGIAILDELKDNRIKDELSRPPYNYKFLPYTGHPLEAGGRETEPIIITNIYAMTLPAKNDKVYYVEAERSYKWANPYPDYPCRGSSFFKAYVKEKGGKFSLLDSSLVLTDCDMKQAARTKPFGLIDIGKNYYLITENRYYESESYDIYKLMDNKLIEVLSVFGGGC